MKFHLIFRDSSCPEQPRLQPAFRRWGQRSQQIGHVVIDALQLLRGQCGPSRPIHLVDPIEAPGDEIRFRFFLDGQIGVPGVCPRRDVHRLADQFVQIDDRGGGGSAVRRIRGGRITDYQDEQRYRCCQLRH